MLGQQFMHNAGAPYKFIIKTFSQPMAEAAPVIAEALNLLKNRVNLLVPCDFNEILSVAYMEGQRMEVRNHFASRVKSSITTTVNLVFEMSLRQLVLAAPQVPQSILN